MERPHPAYKGSEPYVFVSYSHEDAELVYPEIRLLQEQGCNIWYDEGISPGSRWSDAVAEALSSAETLIFFCTPHSSKSGHCADEISFALEEKVPTIAVHLLQLELSAGLKLRLGTHQAILKYELTEQNYRAKLLGSISQSNKSVDSTSEPHALKRDTESSLAILPFANISSDPEQGYFSDGISEEIINALVKTNTIPVIARTSSFKFRGEEFDVSEIGEKLRVSHILEGSVRKAGDTIRITAQLIECTTGLHLWSERYDRSLDDVFAIQDEISLAIVEEIQAHLAGEVDPPVETGAKVTNSVYDLYLKALDNQSKLSPAALAESIALYEQVVQLDPDYVDGWVGLGTAHLWLTTPIIGGESPVTGLALAKRAVRKALDLNPNHAKGLSLLGQLTARADGRWKDGFRLMERAISLSPQDAEILASYGGMLNQTKQANAEEFLQRAYRLDPLSIAAIWLSLHLMLKGRTLDAARIVEPMLVMESDNYFVNLVLTLINLLNGHIESSRKLFETAKMIAGSDTPAMRTVEMLIAQSIGDIRSATAIQRELAKRLTSEVVPFFRMAWPDEYVLSVYRNAVKNRDLEIVGTLLGDKPTAIADDDWQILLGDMNISELTKPETETGWFRPKENSEKQELLARRIKLPGSYLEKIPGVYRGTVTIVLKLERDQLWLSSPNYQSELIPVEENRFEALENNFWYSLIFDEDSQQVSGLMSHMDQLLVEFKKTEV